MWFEINAFFKDLKHTGKLGAGYLLRHPMALFGRKVAALPIRGIGSVHLRYGTTDDAVLRQVFSRREYDLSKYPQRARLDAAYDRILASGKTPLIIDAGANVGMASIWFARKYPKAHLLAVEPDPDNLEICRANLASYPNVRVVDGAIGAEPGHVGLVNPKGRADAVRTVREEGGGVRIYSVPELLAEAGANAELLLVKVDIEGFESDLFSSNTDWLDRTAALIVEPHDWMLPGQYSSASLQRAVFPRGFEMLIHRESLVFIR